MKKLLLISFLLSSFFAFAGTGSANDAIIFYLAIIAVMSFILAVLYSISFIRKIIKERKEKKVTLPDDIAEGEDIS